MTIRASAKAVIVKDDKILLQCCRDDEVNLDYYELPGGGQKPMENMEDAVKRECLEETGLHIKVIRFFALTEEKITIDSVCRNYPDHAHRIFHIFLCEIEDVPAEAHSEEDTHQVNVRWFPINEVPNLRLRPTNLRNSLIPLLESGKIGYLGASILDSFDK